MNRVGIGYDIHELKKGRPLILGGVQIPHEVGLDGHSDADVLLHAIIDALLGAAALPDIGSYFPPGDPATKNISSLKMLEKAADELGKQGFRIVNIDAVVIAEAPKLSPHRDQIRQTIAAALKLPLTAVSIKGKTNEGLDSIGRGEAIAVYAVASIEK